MEKMDPTKHTTSECLEHWAQGMRKMRPDAFNICAWTNGPLPESMESLIHAPVAEHCGTTVCVWGAAPLLFEGVRYPDSCMAPTLTGVGIGTSLAPQDAASELLGISMADAMNLFSGSRDIQAYANAWRTKATIKNEDAAQALEELAAEYRAMGR